MRLNYIDNSKEFDFGRTSSEYAKFRDIYPESMYEKLKLFGVSGKGKTILDIGTGTGVIPRNLKNESNYYGIDISENQIETAKELSKGTDIKYSVATAEETGFSDNMFDEVIACQCFHYFDLKRAIPEIKRILKPQGKLCKIMMEWLPFEDEMLNSMENLILEYNPDWKGNGYSGFDYKFPEWANGSFEIETIHSYKEILVFTIDNWLGRIRTCRGIGASLPIDEIERFNNEHLSLLREYEIDGYLKIPHQINIEIYRLKGQ